MRRNKKILKQIDVFKSFTPDELKDLASYLCEAKYGRGDTIIKEGEVGDSLFIILTGGSCGKCKKCIEYFVVSFFPVLLTLVT